MSNNWAQLIKNIVSNGQENGFQFHIAQVLTDDECAITYKNIVGRETCYDIVNYVVAVKLITDKSADSNTNINTGQNKSNNLDSPTVYPYVRLMVGVEDGQLLVPSPGSHVMVAISSWHDPFIIQYSAIENFIFSSISNDQKTAIKVDWLANNLTQSAAAFNGNGTQATDITFQTQFGQDSSGFDFKTDSTNNPNQGIEIDRNQFVVDIQDKAGMTINESSFSTVVGNSAGTVLTQSSSKFNMSNSSTDFATILQKLLTQLTTATYINSGGTPTPLVFTDTGLDNLTELINSLFGN